MVTEDTYEPTITALGDGSNTSHTIGFEFQDNDHVQVTVQDEGDTPFTREVLTYGTGPGAFTITGGDPGTTVVMGTALAADQRAIIERVTPDEQSVDYDSVNNFPADDHEEQMDRAMMLLQENSWKSDQAIRLRENSDGDVPLLEDPQDKGGYLVSLNTEEDALEFSRSLDDFDGDVSDTATAAAAAAASASAASTSASAAAASAAAASAVVPALGAANTVLNVNAGATASQFTKITTSNLDPAAGITNAQSASMAQSTIKGRAASAGTGDPTDLTATQATAILDNMVGDTGTGGTKGLVPAPAAGDAAALKFLKADGTWAAPAGAGDVVGPGSAHDGGLTLFDGTTGKLIKEATLTQHNMLIAGANNTITSLAPSTSGKFAASDGTDWTSRILASADIPTTLTALATISTAAGCAVHGTNTNDSASSGYVGEYLDATAASVNLSATLTTNVTSVSLTAGDWDVVGVCEFDKSTSTPNSTNWLAAISLNSASITGCVEGQSQGANFASSTNSTKSTVTVFRRISISSTTTVYLVANATASAGQVNANGSLSCRRAR